MGEDSFNNISWMTDEIKNELKRRNKIIENKDFESLYSLKNDSDFSIALHQILVNRYDKDPNSLNKTELNLFLCMHIENADQADSILSFLQEWFPEQKEQIVKSLNEIGATKSSKIIKRAIELLPKDESCFFKSSDENSEKEMSKLGNEFSNYPDGSLRYLYRKYAEKHKNEIFKNPSHNNDYK
ncbi:hypothetical protein [uncultured Tenacibaculum sp.]|uniref:DMP19 family protein n=1 Tax=uncultured Tenacibaculum sp. TaxID=174713 RepID=UPI00260FAC8B|nr:hypothetical protein [uncultured Tenacibaculum sp.]